MKGFYSKIKLKRRLAMMHILGKSFKLKVVVSLIFLLSLIISGNLGLASEVEKTICVVQGKGDVRTAPDMTILNIGVEIVAPAAELAQRQNAAIMEDVIATLLKFEIKRTEIKTVGFYMWQAIEYEEGRQVFKGFRVTHSLEVYVMDVTSAGKVLDAVVKAGVNIINDVRYYLKNPKHAYNQALLIAVDNARYKADVLAKAQGKRVERLEKIVELEVYGPYYGAEGGAREEFLMTPFVPGQLKIEAKVECTFILSE
ncbi:SIMPL domain-containing protein [Candidatus Aerophobetes bacterium]|nr:SIMPL domain-containing protein [Candidatus Aerophobetes bacterium]